MREAEAATGYFLQQPNAVESLGVATQAQQTAGADHEPNSRQWPEPPAEEAYYGLAGEAVRGIEPYTEADPAGILGQYLVSFGNAVGRSAYFSVESSRHYMNEFICPVGATASGRKGTGKAHVDRIFSEADPYWFDKRQQSGLSTGEGLIHAVRDPVEVREAVREDGRSAGRVLEYQTVVPDEGEADKRLLVFESEFAQPLKLMSREGNILGTILRQAWDRGDLRTLPKRNAERATGAHISIIGHITREDLVRHLTETDQANGFGNRFLWPCVKRSRILPDGSPLPDEILTKAIAKLRPPIEFAKRVGEMQRDSEAQEIWRGVYPKLSEGKLGLFGKITSRAEAHVLRLSCIYALLDSSAAVRREHLLAALAFWDFCEQSARFLFGDSLGDPMADQILRALKDAPNGLLRSEIGGLFGRNKPSREIGRALGVLAESGLATLKREDSGGRPGERWAALVTSTR